MFLLLGIIAALQCVDSARILGFFPSPSKSHLIVHSALADVLAENGHNVTVVATLPKLDENAAYRHIHVNLPDQVNTDDYLLEIVNNPMPFYKRFGGLMTLIMDHSNATMYHPTVQRLMVKESFDLVILGYFINDFHLGLAAHFQCPVIVSFMLQPLTILHEMVGNPAEISYVPTIFSEITQPMGFFERVQNFLYLAVLEQVILRPMWIFRMDRLYE